MVAPESISPEGQTSIEMFEAGGEWCVRIVENGAEQVSSFVIESFAQAFADGQRLRLGLDSVGRP
jgi:hypothetical protein